MKKRLTPELFKEKARRMMEGTLLGCVLSEINLSTDEKGFIHEHIIDNIKKSLRVGIKLALYPEAKKRFQDFLDYLNSDVKHNNMFGMRLSQLDLKILQKVVIIYEDVTGGRGFDEAHEGMLERIKRDLSAGNASEWRFGSKLSFHSKLWVRRVCRVKEGNDIDQVIEFIFAGNTDKPERKDEEDEMAKKFSDAVDVLLTIENIGIKIIRERRTNA